MLLRSRLKKRFEHSCKWTFPIRRSSETAGEGLPLDIAFSDGSALTVALVDDTGLGLRYERLFRRVALPT